MQQDLIKAVAEFRKLEKKRKQPGGKLTPSQEKKLIELKEYLEHVIHGKKPESNRRDNIRVPINMRVRYGSGEIFAHNYIKNLSSGGVFIATKKPLPLDTVVKLILVFEEEHLELKVEGKVVWENTKSGTAFDKKKMGMGIKFTKVDSETRDAIDDLIHDTIDEHIKREQERNNIDAEKKKRRESEKRVRRIFGKKKK